MKQRGLLIAVTVAVFALGGLMTPTARAEDAAALFKTKCAPCHGAAGKGDTVMGKKLGIKDLSSAEVQKLTDAELENVIAKGKDKMPAFGTKLTAAQVKDLVAFIRGLKAK